MIETIRAVQRLMDDGFTWEEAEEILWAQAERENDAERDRELEEKLTGESK